MMGRAESCSLVSLNCRLRGRTYIAHREPLSRRLGLRLGLKFSREGRDRQANPAG
jgi:hypothetical protein